MKEIIKNSSFFKGLEDDKIENILKCISYKKVSFDKDIYLYDLSQGFKTIILVDGIVDMVSVDENAKEIIDARFYKNDSIVYDFSKDERILKSKTDSILIYLDARVIFDESKKSCKHRALFMENIIKNLNNFMNNLSFKVDLYSKNHLRDKILLFLEYEKDASNYVNLMANQEDLAKYLSCNRSALSRELSLMEKEGLIKIKNKKIFIK